MLLFSLLTFFKAKFFTKHTEPLSECQTVWIQIKTDIMLVFVWVRTVCKGYPQKTKFSTGMQTVITGKYVTSLGNIQPRYTCTYIYIKDIWTLLIYFDMLCLSNKAIEDIQMFLVNVSLISLVKWTITIFHSWLMFLLNMSFISQVKWTIFIFHEWQSHE